jgi:hypothetical protein
VETNYKITIPKPCHEDWDQMTPDQTGRFCNSCAKSVIDFSNMKTPEIQAYFIKNQGKNVCGRFKNEQINKFDIQVPQSILQKKMPFHKAFILALFIAMGSSLFSCKNHDNATLGKVSVVHDSVKKRPKDTIAEKEQLGKVDVRRYDSLVKAGVKMPPLPPPPPIKQVKFIKPKNKVFALPNHTTGITAVNLPDSALKNLKDKIYTYSTVQVRPEFPVGIWEFYEYFNANFKISEEDEKITKKVFTSFIINTDGSLSDIKINRGINERIDAEVLRVLKSCPKWIPGEQNGEKVRVSIGLPIQIKAKE